jgi:peptidylprolyl isomerase
MVDPPPGMGEILLALRVGEKARLWVPMDKESDKLLIVDISLLGKTSPPEFPGAAPTDAKVLDGEIRTLTLEEGQGSEKPEPHDAVLLEYNTWNAEGSLIDSSLWSPEQGPVDVEALPTSMAKLVTNMLEGEKLRLWLPTSMTEGQGALVIEMKLLQIENRPAPLPAPPDVAAPPKRAKRTKSGLRYVVLQKKSTSKKRPDAISKVKVHYTGWTTDGEMFDSSVVRGTPATFPLNAVIPGWTEGVQLMRPGQHFRFWIPSELAYDGREGAPQGMLVFDVELISVEE